MKHFSIALVTAAVIALGCAGGPDVKGGSAKAAAGTVVYSNDFEKDTGGFAPKGPVNVGISDEVAHSGKQSLKTFDRSQSWHAPELTISSMVAKNGVYTVNCWFYVPKDSPISAVKLTVQTTKDGSTNWVQIAKPVSAEPGKWVQLTGEYNKSGSFEQITVYVEPIDPEGTFYVDDFSITAAQ